MTKLQRVQREIELMKKLFNGQHYSNCMIYAGTSCDCGVADDLEKIKVKEAERDALVQADKDRVNK
jgi:hypothetical protein